jgi:hypothetical protein
VLVQTRPRDIKSKNQITLIIRLVASFNPQIFGGIDLMRIMAAVTQLASTPPVGALIVAAIMLFVWRADAEVSNRM